MNKIRFRQFRLRSLLLLLTIACMIFGLLAARLATVNRLNEARRIVDEATFEVLIANRSPQPAIGSHGHPAGLTSTGRSYLSATDDKSFHIETDFRAPGILGGKPVLTITCLDAIGPCEFDPQHNRELCSKIAKRIPPETVTVVVIHKRLER